MRSRRHHGAWALALMLALLPLSGEAADPESKPAAGDSDAAAQSADESSAVEADESTGQEQPAEPFVPSESISADSAISFPVDI